MFLCIGPTNSGKTSLVARLTNDKGSDDDFFTVPTVGTNLTVIPGRKRKPSISIRELGGVMAPIWSSYFSDCRGLLFVVDGSNRRQVAASTILLLTALSNEVLHNVPTLIILNKVDTCENSCLEVIKFTMRLDDIVRHATQSITIIECSVRTGKGMVEIRNWLDQTNDSS